MYCDPAENHFYVNFDEVLVKGNLTVFKNTFLVAINVRAAAILLLYNREVISFLIYTNRLNYNIAKFH